MRLYRAAVHGDTYVLRNTVDGCFMSSSFSPVHHCAGDTIAFPIRVDTCPHPGVYRRIGERPYLNATDDLAIRGEYDASVFVEVEARCLPLACVSFEGELVTPDRGL